MVLLPFLNGFLSINKLKIVQTSTKNIQQQATHPEMSSIKWYAVALKTQYNKQHQMREYRSYSVV